MCTNDGIHNRNLADNLLTDFNTTLPKLQLLYVAHARSLVPCRLSATD